jgi:mannose-6-phosphate isomerase-like protein (cupin superfamily)
VSHTSQATAPIKAEFGLATDRTAHLDGYTVQFVSIHEDHDLAPMLKGLPDDACHCPHWGYVLSGQLTVRYITGEEEQITSGDAYYMPPGHTPSALAGTELVMISPQAELEATEAAIMANMARFASEGATPATS